MPGRARSTVFVAVGAAGFVLQISALAALVHGAGVPHLYATAAAVELAVLHNFAWHERWTWADRRRGVRSGVWKRLGRFHLANGVVSVAGNLLGTAWLAGAGAPLLLANALSVVVCTAVNFAVADRLVFRCEQEVEA